MYLPNHFSTERIHSASSIWFGVSGVVAPEETPNPPNPANALPGGVWFSEFSIICSPHSELFQGTSLDLVRGSSVLSELSPIGILRVVPG